jgi:hypothetical protein
MSACVPVSLPRWQWRTFAADLSWLSHRLPVPRGDVGWRAEEIHLVCSHSTHHAWVLCDTLELRWRKEVGPEGFELWDTILHTRVPFSPTDISRLFAAWGVPEWHHLDGNSVQAFLAGVASAGVGVEAVRLVREGHVALIDGVSCVLETITGGSAGPVQSFSVEHEDPSLMASILSDLGLDARDNINFLQGLKRLLGTREQRS